MAPSLMRANGDTCPELEVIAAYLDGRLNERERADVARHVAGCESCYFVFTEAAQLRVSDAARQAVTKKLDEPVPTAKWWATPKVAWSFGGVLATAAAVVLMVAAGVIPTGAPASSELRMLVEAVGT